MKVLLLIALVSSSCAAAALPADLGLLTKYYHDCPASHGRQVSYLRAMIKRAQRGDYAAMRRVITHEGVFSTGDNEGYSEVPQDFCGRLETIDILRSLSISSAMFRSQR